MEVMKTVARALLGTAVVGLSMVSMAGSAQAASLSFCFNAITEDAPCNNDEVVKYCVGTGFKTLLQFAACGKVADVATCLTGGGGTKACFGATNLSLTTTDTLIKFEAISDVECQGCALDQIDTAKITGLGNTALGACGTVATFNLVSFPAIGQVTFQDNNGSLVPAGQFHFNTNVVPEPSTYISLFGGLGLLWASRKRKKDAA